MFTQRLFGNFIESMDCCPWSASAGRMPSWSIPERQAPRPGPLYTPEQRRRRDETPWTMVQGILSPVQFLAFLVSLCLVLRYLATGAGEEVMGATAAAIANAFYDATGARMRQFPMTPERELKALELQHT